MTYQEIISQVSRILGYATFSNQLKADLRYAIRFAEQELQRETQMVKRNVEIALNKDTGVYELPDNYSEPKEIIVMTTDGAELAYEEVTFEQWLRFTPHREAITTASSNEILRGELDFDNMEEFHRYRNRVMVAVTYKEQFDDQSPPQSLGHKYRLHIKPGIDGVLQLYYTPVFVVDPFEDTNQQPPYPPQFHQYIISGAVAYLAQGESSKIRASGDIEGALFYSRLATIHQNQFDEHKRQIISKVDKRKSAGVIRGFAWYDNPSKYR